MDLHLDKVLPRKTLLFENSMTDIHFRKSYAEYFRRCVLFAKSYIYDDMIAENIASEAIVILWDKLNQGIDVQYPLPFLMGVVRNKVLHYLRSKESDSKLHEGLRQKSDIWFCPPGLIGGF